VIGYVALMLILIKLILKITIILRIVYNLMSIFIFLIKCTSS